MVTWTWSQKTHFTSWIRVWTHLFLQTCIGPLVVVAVVVGGGVAVVVVVFEVLYQSTPVILFPKFFFRINECAEHKLLTWDLKRPSRIRTCGNSLWMTDRLFYFRLYDKTSDWQKKTLKLCVIDLQLSYQHLVTAKSSLCVHKWTSFKMQQ